MVTNVRKAYLYDALHNLTLLAAFIAIILVLWGTAVDTKLFVAGAVAGAFVFNQLPYMIGQSQLRNEVLKNYRNSKRVDMEEELKKYAALFPKWDFASVLISPLTAGGIVHFLTANLIENALQL